MKIAVEDIGTKLDALAITEPVPSDPKATELAYKIAAALAKKFKGKVLGLRTQRMESERLVFEYTLSEGKHVASTAYTEGFFDKHEADHTRWLATRIYTELTQRHDWLTRGKK